MTQAFTSIGAMFHWRVQKTPDAIALYRPTNPGWEPIRWDKLQDLADGFAAGLLSMGLELEQRVGLWASTRVEWIFADLGIVCAGGVTATVYPNSTAEEASYILNDSGAAFCVAEGDAQVEKLRAAKGELPNIQKVITFDSEASDDGWIIPFDDVVKAGHAHLKDNPDCLAAIEETLTPEHLATLIYTSGTTGRPKGVELLHDCWIYTGEAMHKMGFMASSDKQYLWLPMSHSFGKLLLMAIIRIGIPTAVDGRVTHIVDNLAEVQPTFMAAAPRIFEKVYNKVVTGAKEAGGAKYAIFKWAIGVGRQVSLVKQRGRSPVGLLAMKAKLADKLVFSKLRDRFGGKIRFFVSGSAPLSRDMAEFFHAAGMLILEGYGLTESSAASFVNRPGDFAFGTVGHPLPGTEVKIDPADGEILMRGRGIMRGYYNLPDVTADTLDDGWLRTGDIGELDDAGRLKITDRKKDLIKTSGGKYVAPQHLEGKLKAKCPYLSQVLVHGNARNYCSALVTLDPDSAPKWAEEVGLGALSLQDLAKHEKTYAMVQEAVDELNQELARYETIKKFAILEDDFSEAGGELTPSLKVKRKVVETKYKEVLDGFYDGSLAEV